MHDPQEHRQLQVQLQPDPAASQVHAAKRLCDDTKQALPPTVVGLLWSRWIANFSMKIFELKRARVRGGFQLTRIALAAQALGFRYVRIRRGVLTTRVTCQDPQSCQRHIDCWV